MRVLIIATNRVTFPNAVPPLGAATITSSLRKAGHQTELLDLCHTTAVRRTLQRTLRRFDPNIVGISMRNLDSCSYHRSTSYIDATRDVIAAVKDETNAPIIVGGAAVTIGGVDLLKELGVELGVIGEGESSSAALIKALSEGRTRFDSIPGVISLNGRTPTVAPPEPLVSLDDFPLNDVSMVRMTPYLRHGGMVGIQTKRGCPFKCIYCNYPAIEGNRYRLRSPEVCVDDMERIAHELGVTDFFFADSVFNQPTRHALDICEAIIRRGLSIRWMAYCNPRGFDREVARTFRYAGCVGVELGLDAATDSMLSVYHKGFTQQDISAACDALYTEGIPFAHFLLFGGPGETWSDIVEARHFLDSIQPAAAIFASLGLRIYRNTRLYEHALEDGQVSAGDTLLSPVFSVSRELGPDPIRELDRVARKTTTWLTPTDWESPIIKLVHTAKGRLRRFPSWQGIEAYGKRMRRFSRNA